MNDAYRIFHGMHVAVFGPNFIWTGKLKEETNTTIHITNVYQVHESREHTTPEADKEKICENMIFEKTAICNVGAPLWAVPPE